MLTTNQDEKGRILYLTHPPEPVHFCSPPLSDDCLQAKHYIGTVWECGECNRQWIVFRDSFDIRYWRKKWWRIKKRG